MFYKYLMQAEGLDTRDVEEGIHAAAEEDNRVVGEHHKLEDRDWLQEQVDRDWPQ